MTDLVTGLLSKALDAGRGGALHAPVGTVVEVLGLTLSIAGLTAAVGEALEVETDHGRLEVDVIGFRAEHLLATPLGSMSGIRPGARVRRAAHGPTVSVGDALLGRVVDPFGVPLDGQPIATAARRSVHAAAPDAFTRRPIERVFETGVRVLDATLTIGAGQRVGIFSGAGIGKSSLLGMICRASKADVNVVGLIGERGREVQGFVRGALGEEGMQRSVVVAATSDQPPVVRARGAETATAIAEYFRDQGLNVLLVMDSVTRYAMALRETALSAGEPPATKGYPPSVFAALPRLLERTGTADGKGVITAFYAVLVEGDDLADPIADSVRSLLDGHIVLTRELMEHGHFPAVDILQSVSRLAQNVTTLAQQMNANALRALLAAYRNARDLIQIGAYQAGSDPKVDVAVALLPAIEVFLRQRVDEKADFEQTVGALQMLAQNAAAKARVNVSERE